MVDRYVMKSEHNLFIDCLPYEWQSGTSDGLLVPIYPPRSMRVVLWFLMTSKFLQQVYEFFWLMLSPWIIRTPFTPPLLLASLVSCNFRRYHKPTILLPQNSHHTYLLWHFHSHSEIYFHATFHRSVYYDTFHLVILLFAWSRSWHCICGKATFIIFIHVTLDSLHTPVHRWRHSYRAKFCSRYRVNKSVRSSNLEHCPIWGNKKKGVDK